MLAVNPQVPVFRTTPLSARLDEATPSERLTATLVTVCGGMALLLASIGVYGVVATAWCAARARLASGSRSARRPLGHRAR